MHADPSNPFHQASFYVESLKYGPGAGHLEGATKEEIDGALEVLLRDAGVTSLTGAELTETLDYYAESLAYTFRMPRIIAKSLFTDGVMHGLAFGAGLKGEPRE